MTAAAKSIAIPRCGGPTPCAEHMAISPAQACWKIGSTRPRAATGSSLRYIARIETGQRTGGTDVKQR
jgi:hypothetical protein